MSWIGVTRTPERAPVATQSADAYSRKVTPKAIVQRLINTIKPLRIFSGASMPGSYCLAYRWANLHQRSCPCQGQMNKRHVHLQSGIAHRKGKLFLRCV